jgi:hypothetical protein
MSLSQVMLIGCFLSFGAAVLYLGVHLLWYLALRLQTPRSRARVIRIHGDVVINATVRPSRIPED